MADSTFFRNDSVMCAADRDTALYNNELWENSNSVQRKCDLKRRQDTQTERTLYKILCTKSMERLMGQ
jgi:hypothetical protein